MLYEHSKYIDQSCLPLAQLYQRCVTSKGARDRHSNCFYLLEAYIKLAASPQIACYLDEIDQGQARVEKIDLALRSLALPSLGHWVGFLRELSRHFGNRVDHATHPLGHVWGQLNEKRTDEHLLQLYRCIKNGPEAEPTKDQHFSLLKLFDCLVQYRNIVFGHGANRHDEFYEQKMGPLMMPAINELLADNVLDCLGPFGSRLVYVSTKRDVDEETTELELKELIGFYSKPVDPIRLPSQEVVNLASDRVGVLWPGRKSPLILAPLLIYRQKGMAEEVMFLNRDRNGRHVEHLCYSSGETEKGKQMVPVMARLLSKVTGKEVSEKKLEELAEQSFANTPSIEAVLEQPSAPKRIMGDFEILCEIGRGGMGVVYLARQQSLGRLVALKTLPADLIGNETAVARFRREIRALGQCDHPNIIQVLSSGSLPSGQMYYAMEYVPGASLEQAWQELTGQANDGDMGTTTWGQAVLTASQKLRERTRRLNQTKVESANPEADLNEVLPRIEVTDFPQGKPLEDSDEDYQRRIALLVRDLALALHEVHEQGIVHRDVKPSNMMLTPEGSRIILMDFGLAKSDQTKTLAESQQAGLLGTLRYAAPEQLRVANLQLKIDRRADIRALGATLWELLSQERLFADAGDEGQLAQMVLTQDVPLLSTVDKSIHPDLEAIVARATEREATNRISTAKEMADYLDLYLANKPIPIRTPSTAELMRRWVREHRKLVASIVLFSLLLAITIASFVFLLNEEKEHQKELARDLQQSVIQKDRLLDQKNAALANLETEKHRSAEEFRKAIERMIADDNWEFAITLYELQDKLTSKFATQNPEFAYAEDILIESLSGFIPACIVVGKTKRAEQLLTQILTVLEKTETKDVYYASHLAWAKIEIGNLRWHEGFIEQTALCFAEGARHFEELVSESADAEQKLFFEKEYARTNYKLGEVYQLAGEFAKAEDCFAKSISYFTTSEEHYEELLSYARARQKLGSFYHEIGDFEKSRRNLNTAYRVFSQQLDSNFLFDVLQIVNYEIAKVDVAQKQYEDAAKRLEEVVSHLSTLSVEPAYRFERDVLAEALLEMGRLAQQKNDLEDAKTKLARSLQIRRTTLEMVPTQALLKLQLSKSLTAMGEWHVASNESEKAIDYLIEARDLLRKLVDENRWKYRAQQQLDKVAGIIEKLDND